MREKSKKFLIFTYIVQILERIAQLAYQNDCVYSMALASLLQHISCFVFICLYTYRVINTFQNMKKRRFFGVLRKTRHFCNTYRVLSKFCKMTFAQQIFKSELPHSLVNYDCDGV